MIAGAIILRENASFASDMPAAMRVQLAELCLL
jgi:hypothetical protein